MHTATFLTDIPSLFGLGIIITVILTLASGRRLTHEGHAALQKRINRTILIATALFICLIEIPTFLDVPYAVLLMKAIPAADGMTGNEFMWHGYFRWPGRWVCEFLTSGPSDASCVAYDPPVGEPGKVMWWPVIAFCFLLQWLAAKLGQRIAPIMNFFRTDDDSDPAL